MGYKNFFFFTFFLFCKILINYPKIKIKDYEKPILNENTFFGTVIINDTELLKPAAATTNQHGQIHSTEQKGNTPRLSNEDDHTKIHMFGTLRVQLRKVTEQMSEFQQLFKSPTLELDIPTLPNFMTNYKSNIFTCDDEGNLTVADLNDELTIKFTNKLSFSNIKGMAVNSTFVAILYTDISRDDMKSIIKKLGYKKKVENKNGIAFYKWDEGPFRFDKINDFYKQPEIQGGLMAPNGICMNENFLFIIDRELKGVFKVDLKSGDVIQKFLFIESEPIGIGLCNQFLVIIDSRNQEVSKVDIDKLTLIKSVKIGEDFQSFGGCYDMAVHQKNYLFVKNRSDTRVMIFDLNLQFKNCFEYEGSSFQGISVVKTASTNEKINEVLVIGKNVDNKSFKLGYFNDFQ